MPQVRRSGKSDWEDISWNQALNKIARKVKETRNRGFAHLDDQWRVVNRCENIVFVGGVTETNEFCWTVVQTMVALRATRRENVARTWHGPSVSSLGGTFGRGARRRDCIFTRKGI